jgi:outer membrane protein insertion porin family
VSDIQRTAGTVNVAMEITEGRQAFISRVEIMGNVRTRDKVIRRQLRLVEGDVFSSVSLQRSRRDLQNLGFFEEVKLDTRRAAAEDKVDVSVEVKEKPTGAFTVGGGFSSVDGPIGVASISQNNLFGLGKRASITGQLGQRANRFNLVYTDPNFLDTDFLVEARGFDTQQRFQANQGFNQSNRGGGLTVGHLLVEEIFGTVSYGYDRVRIKDVQDAAPFLVRRQAETSGGVSNTSAMTLALTRDTRDSFSEPTRGLRARAAFEYAGGFLDADNNFTKYSLEMSQYWRLWWKLVGHIRGSIAYGEPFSDTPDLPVQERFFLGGTNSIRGFRNFTISPKETGGGDGLTGGNKAFFLNNEILFPLYEPLRMRGLVFVDLGNVFDEREKFEWSVKRAAGLGIRFTSPIGAIRLEYGFNLAPGRGERSSVLHFSAGAAF